MITPTQRSELLAICERARREYPMIGGGLIDNHLPADDPAWDYAAKALGYLAARSDDGLASELEAFAMVSMDFLRLQARFMKTRKYARAGAGGLVAELYGDDEKMRGYYLDGLALTYALWPNHARMITFMATEFLPHLQPGSRVAEVGVGHGLLAALMFDAEPGIDYTGVDISPSALDYAAESLGRLGVEPSRFRMVNADATSGGLALLGGDSGFDALVCCEVVEHVDDPGILLTRVSEAVRPDGWAFVSTVANMEADDHVYLFDDVAQIREMCTGSGWRITSDLANVLPGAENWDPLPVNYCGVLRPAR